MEKTTIGVKSKNSNWDFIGGEIVFGLMFVTAVLLAALIPLEADAAYVRYIFAGLAVVFFVPLLLIVFAHVRFSKAPEIMLELVDETNLFNRCDNVMIRLKDVDDINVKTDKNKYGKPYSYGTLKLTVGSKVYVLKRISHPDDVKNALLECKERAERQS